MSLSVVVIVQTAPSIYTHHVDRNKDPLAGEYRWWRPFRFQNCTAITTVAFHSSVLDTITHQDAWRCMEMPRLARAWSFQARLVSAEGAVEHRLW